MLNFQGLEHEMVETTSPTFIDTFVEGLNIDEMSYTEFVVLGGDGLFSQLLNAIQKHPENKKLLSMPIGLMPCGSSNALCCGLGGKDPYIAAISIVRGYTVKGDMFSVNLNDKPEVPTIYATTLTYGFPSDIVIEAQKLRPVFGQYRYIATGAKKFVCSIRLPRYLSNVEFNLEELGVEDTKENETERSERVRHSEMLHLQRFPVIEQNIQFDRKSIAPPAMKIDEKYHSLEDVAEGKWKALKSDKYLFYTIVTHEAASSVEAQSYVPFARIDDGQMYLLGMERCSKLEALNYMIKFNNGTHYRHKKMIIHEAKEFRIENPKGAFFCVDGEIYQSNDISIKLVPSALKLMGAPAPFSKDALKFKTQINSLS